MMTKTKKLGDTGWGQYEQQCEQEVIYTPYKFQHIDDYRLTYLFIDTYEWMNEWIKTFIGRN